MEMPPDSVSVTLAVGLAPYEKSLASSLLRAGMLRRVCDLGPYLEIREPDGHGSLKTIRRFSTLGFSTRAVWAIWRRLPKSVFPWPPVGLQVCVADRLLANWIVPSTICHGCTGVCLTSLKTARRQGSITLVKIASRHPRHWQQTRIEESQRLGVKVNDGIVHLTKNAWVSNGEDEIRGESLKYNVLAQSIVAEASEQGSQRVHIIITPPPPAKP